MRDDPDSPAALPPPLEASVTFPSVEASPPRKLNPLLIFPSSVFVVTSFLFLPSEVILFPFSLDAATAAAAAVDDANVEEEDEEPGEE